MALIKPSDGFPFVSYFLSLAFIFLILFIFFQPLIFNWLQHHSWKTPPLESPADSAESCSCFHKQFDV